MTAINFPARARAVDAGGGLTPEFFRALRAMGAASYGAMSFAGNAGATTIAGIGTPVLVSGTTTAGLLSGFDHTNGRLTYTGAASAVLTVSVMASLTSTSGNKCGIAVAVNGSPVAEGYVTAGTGAAFVSAQKLVELVQGDYLEAFVSNETATNAVTVSDLSLICR